jgi:hypothetical protein
LGCTLPTFLATASGVLRRTDVAGGLPLFVAYAIGMGLVLTGLTVTLALARHSLVGHLRRMLPYVQRIAGVFLVVAGAYVAYYGWYELRVFRDPTTRDSIVEGVTGAFDNLRAWAIELGGVRLAAVFLVLILGAVGVAVYARRRSAGGTQTGPAEPADAVPTPR